MIKLDFFGPGAGSSKKIEQVLSIEESYGNITITDKYSWGREGQKTICLEARNLKNLQRMKEILDVLTDPAESCWFCSPLQYRQRQSIANDLY